MVSDNDKSEEGNYESWKTSRRLSGSKFTDQRDYRQELMIRGVFWETQRELIRQKHEASLPIFQLRDLLDRIIKAYWKIMEGPDEPALNDYLLKAIGSVKNNKEMPSAVESDLLEKYLSESFISTFVGIAQLRTDMEALDSISSDHMANDNKGSEEVDMEAFRSMFPDYMGIANDNNGPEEDKAYHLWKTEMKLSGNKFTTPEDYDQEVTIQKAFWEAQRCLMLQEQRNELPILQLRNLLNLIIEEFRTIKTAAPGGQAPQDYLSKAVWGDTPPQTQPEQDTRFGELFTHIFNVRITKIAPAQNEGAIESWPALKSLDSRLESAKEAQISANYVLMQLSSLNSINPAAGDQLQDLKNKAHEVKANEVLEQLIQTAEQTISARMRLIERDEAIVDNLRPKLEYDINHEFPSKLIKAKEKLLEERIQHLGQVETLISGLTGNR